MTTTFREEVKKRKKITDEPTTVRGIVVPVDWDEEGNTLAAAISSPDEQEYLIKQDPKGKELLRLMRQEIEAMGVVKKGSKGRKIIKINNYELWREDSQE
jgi:hypothetical protein